MRSLLATLLVIVIFITGCTIQAPPQPQPSPTPVLPAPTLIPTLTPLMPTPTPPVPTSPLPTPTVIPTAFTSIPAEMIKGNFYSLDFGPAGWTVANGSIWATNSVDNSIRRVDLETNKETARISIPFPCAGPVVGFDSVWVIDCQNDVLVRIDMKTNEITAKIDLLSYIDIRDILVWENAVWVVSDIKGVLVRIDPATNLVTDEYNVKPQSALLTGGFGSIWVTRFRWWDGSYDNTIVQRLDPATKQVIATIEVGKEPAQLGVGGGSIWLFDISEGSLYRIDPVTNTSITIPVLDPYTFGAFFYIGEETVTIVSGSTWLTIIDVKTNQITRQYIPSPGDLHFIDGEMWILE